MPTYEFTPAAIINGTFPQAALRPRKFGYDRVRPLGDFSAWLFNPLEPAEFVGEPGASILRLQISEAGRPVNGARFAGFHFPGSIQIREGSDNIIENNTFSSISAQPIRIRFGSCRNVIRNNRFQRVGPLPVGDVVAIQIVDAGATGNLDNEISDNLILDYTDGVQLTKRVGEFAGMAAGTRIERNRIGITSGRHNANGSMQDGLENAADIKADGTEGNPILLTDNEFFGYRPNARTPGYAATIHPGVTNVVATRNSIVSCEAGWMLKGGTTQFLRFADNLYQDVRNHGFSSQWPSKQGPAICGTGGGTFEREMFLGTIREELLPVGAAVGSRLFVGCI